MASIRLPRPILAHVSRNQLHQICCIIDYARYNSRQLRNLSDGRTAVCHSSIMPGHGSRPSMPDIVPNLLHLSSEVRDVCRAVGSPSSTWLCSATELPTPRQLPGPQSAKLVGRRRPRCGPVRRALGSRSRGHGTRRQSSRPRVGWLVAIAAMRHGTPDSIAEPGFVLLIRGNCPSSQLACRLSRLSDALAIVERKVTRDVAQSSVSKRCSPSLTNGNKRTKWKRCLVRMAEAATQLFDADRASIFLWDKPNKTDRRPARARHRRRRASTAR